MISKNFVLIIGLIFVTSPCLYADAKKPQLESDQKITDFSLAGYGEKGKKSWDLSGKSADIFTEVVKLKEVVGNLYGKEENIKLTSARGDFNKNDGKVHLEKDVIITTSSGTKMTTDSLDWDRKNQLVTTKDTVNIQKDNMVIMAQGVRGQTNFKRIALEKDVRLDINPVLTEEGNPDTASEQEVNSPSQEKIVITCDGPLEVDYDKNIATFNNNVKVKRQDTVIYSDTMDVYFIASNKAMKQEEGSVVDQNQEITNNKIDKIAARGNVKVVRGENISYSDEAIYTAVNKKFILTGRPKLIISSAGSLDDAPLGN